VLEVTVAPQHTFDRTVTIQPDGTISYPVLGRFQAAGLTVAELEAKLRDGLNAELVDPQVSVVLKEFKQAVRRVNLLGAVHNPNVFELKEGDTLADVLVAGGNPTPRADLRHVTLMHASGATTVVDLISKEEPAAAQPEAPAERIWRLGRNVPLQAGDVILVREGAAPSALVLGEVNKAGSYEIQGETRLLDLLALAGGPAPKADLRRISLRHAGDTETQTLDLQPLLVLGDTSQTALNVSIQPGDTVVLAETDQVVYVAGRVARPGIYALKPNQRVLDVLLDTGYGADAGTHTATLVHRGPDGKPVPRTLDLNKIMAKGDQTENEVLRPGDVLYVPEKRTKRQTLEMLNLLLVPLSLFHLW